MSSSKQNLLHSYRQADEMEASGGEGVIFTALIHDAQIAMCDGFLIMNYLVELADFEGCLVAGVIQADRELFRRCLFLFHRRPSGCLQKGFLSYLRQLDYNEAILRIKVILTGLVNHPQIAVFGGNLVRQNLVYLAKLQVFPIFVVNAEDKLWRVLFSVHTACSIKVAFDLHLLLADSVGFVPVKFHSPHSAILKPDVTDAFQLTPPPFAKLFLQSRQVTNLVAGSDCFDGRDFTN